MSRWVKALATVGIGIFAVLDGPSVFHYGRNVYWRRRRRAAIHEYNPPRLVILGSGWGAVSVHPPILIDGWNVDFENPNTRDV
jgi:hypothetical protein